MDSQVALRPAISTDAEFLGWVIQEAARSGRPVGVWDVAFPGPDAPRLDYLARLTLAEPPSYAHYSRFVVATARNIPVAALCRYEPSHTGMRQLTTALFSTLSAAGWSEDHLRLLGMRMEPALACMPDTPDDTWIVEFVAARPEFRRRGFVHRLLERVLHEGRAAGYRVAQLAVLIGNEPAIRAYEGVGFEIVEVKRDAMFEQLFGCPGVARMRCPLV